MRLPAAFVVAILFPTATLAQECAAEFAALDKQIKGATLQAAYAGKEDTHPMVLNMADGSLVDLTGQIITDEPYATWTGDPAVVDTVTDLIKQSAPLAAEGMEEECLALLEQAQAAVGVSEGASSTDSTEPDAADTATNAAQPGSATAATQPSTATGTSPPGSTGGATQSDTTSGAAQPSSTSGGAQSDTAAGVAQPSGTSSAAQSGSAGAPPPFGASGAANQQ